ncbi:ATP-binding protein [Desulfovibrio ferrophilus]|uniref:Putative anti-sigma regulatory factor, serine/threonine protein kinase n=1 Tax=Desulfovibrio ferrophilus TaxID=241368 RepID=A0A2Z6B103_9BACT|nr:ATP-binding protein [Desulfovibrio ferrophilus]BBD09135.1 putative anti-sigma regulatory factor, serine/threonine protein kinase [Desulfovibrio ferrophilus]
MSEAALSLKMDRDWQTLADCVEQVRGFTSAYDLGERARYVLELVLEEILSNAVRHVPAGERRGVGVTVTVCGRGVSVMFEDRGVPFDPTFEAEQREGLSGDEHGGFGLHLVRNFVDAWEYSRQDGQNTLTVEIEGGS